LSKTINPKIFAEKNKINLIGTINVVDNYHSPSNLTFQSPQSIAELKTIHLIFETSKKKSVTPFGGQNVKITEKLGENKYDVDSHERRLNGKITKVFTNKTANQIIKWVCKKQKVKTCKFAKTTKKHPKLAFEAKKAIDICHQVATLEDNMLFKVNVDGLAELKKIPHQEKGYVFNLTNVTDYELSYDYSNVITGIKVYGEKNKELYSYNNKTMTAKYGVITEIIDDDTITSKSTAKDKAAALFKEKKNPVFAGSITIPQILLNLHAGMWCSFKSKGKYHNYWIGTVATTISNSEQSQKLTLYDGKPAPPSDWIYTPPNDNNLDSCTEKTVTNPQTIEGSCGVCKNKPSKSKGTVSFEDRCTHPSCKNPNKGLSFNPKRTKEGEWTCKACGADYCAKCGKEKLKTSKIYLKKSTSCKAVKGVPLVVANKANELGSLRKCWEWVKNENNIDYELYLCDKKIKGPEKTLSSRGGNCYDKNNLFKYMARQLGYKAQLQCGHKCDKYPHCICYVWINGEKWLVDTTCKGKYQKVKNTKKTK